jgi:hypothetical protein
MLWFFGFAPKPSNIIESPFHRTMFRDSEALCFRSHFCPHKFLICSPFTPWCRSDVPIILVFRALGFVADKDILEHICYDFNDPAMMELLRPSLEEAAAINDQEVSAHATSCYVMTSSSGVKFLKGQPRRKIRKTFLKLQIALYLIVGWFVGRSAAHMGTDLTIALAHMGNRLLNRDS